MLDKVIRVQQMLASTSRSIPQPIGGTQARPTVAAAIFDFDGTLVDTLHLHFQAYRQAFAEAGISLSWLDFYKNIGGNARETIPRLLDGRDCSRSVAELHARKKQIVNEIFADAPITILETAKLLPLLQGSIAMALASSGSRAGIEILLERLNWNQYFQVVVAGEDALRGKPSPDLFLIAAERLGAEPAKCIVFEDTDAGLAAAASAGMESFDVRRTVPPTHGELPT